MSFQETLNNFLAPLEDASTVVYAVVTELAKAESVYHCLLRLGCPFVDDTWKEPSDYLLNKFFSHLCANHENPESILHVLHSVSRGDISEANFDNLNEKEKEILLDYLGENFSCLVRDSIKKIKALPLFQTLQGDFISLDDNDYTYLICDNNTESSELNKVAEVKKVIILNDKLRKLREFFKGLKIAVLSANKMYKTYIIPCMHTFTTSSVIKHMNWIRKNNPDEELCQLLGNAKLIVANNGHKSAIAELYSDNLRELFEVMEIEEKLLPESFWHDVYAGETSKSYMKMEWDHFLKKLGLKDELSSDEFLELARKLESDEAPCEILEKKSKALISYLKKHHLTYTKKNSSFLNSLSSVQFIYGHNVPKTLQDLFPQTEQLKGLICFNGSVKECKEYLCWTVNKLLPTWSTEGLFGPKNLSGLRYLDSPVLKDVVEHMENVCNRLQIAKFKEIKRRDVNEKGSIKILNKVLDAIFNYLKTADIINNQRELERLKKIPCILVDDGMQLVCPNQIVWYDLNFKECPPFLYSLHTDLMEHAKILNILGVEKKPNWKHFTYALQRFYEMFGDKPVPKPNMHNSLFNAYSQFLKQLTNMDPSEVVLEELYLPDKDSIMRRSSDILIVDDIGLEKIEVTGKRIWNVEMVKAIDRGMSVSKYAEVLLKLPQPITPTSYKQFVSEVLSHKSTLCNGSDEEFCENKYNVGRLFQYDMFARVVAKVVNSVEIHLDGQPAEEDKISAFFNQVQVKCYAELRIDEFRKDDKNKLINSRSVGTFWKKNPDNTVEFMVKHEDPDIQRCFVDSLVSLLQLVCPLKTRKDEKYFTAVFDKLDLRRQESSLQEILMRDVNESFLDGFYFTKLGSIVPEDLVALLDQNPDPLYYYREMEIIACILDPCEFDSENVCYIFGQIIKKIANEQSKVKWYLISIGDVEPIKRSILDIYKFIEVREMQESANLNAEDLRLMVMDDSESETKIKNKFDASLEEVLEKISDQLEEFWKLDPDEKKKAIKRMYLYWHPDKNPPDKKEFCEEAFKHLMNEIERLEKGLPRKKATKNNTKESYEDFFSNERFSSGWRDNFRHWHGQARTHKKNRERYYERAKKNWEYCYASTKSSGVPPSFATSAPQEAKLWFQQAKCDFSEAKHSFSGSRPCYEWGLYKCYQVARKSMLAMILTRSISECQSDNLIELAGNLNIIFGTDPGDVFKTVQMMIKNGVDQRRNLMPCFGRTAHDRYKENAATCLEVKEAARKLVNLAQELTK